MDDAHANEPHASQQPSTALVPLEAAEQPEVHYPDGRIEHPWVRREHRDVQVGKILAFMAVVIVLACVHLYSFRWLFRGYEGTKPTHDAAAYRGISADALPHEPRLEQLSRLAEDTRPNVYLRQQHAEAALDRYAPTDDDAFVQVPIERAIDILPARVKSRKDLPTSADKRNGLVDAGESNSGRMLRGSP